MQSNLKSITPVITATGAHRYWESQNFPGINYDFTATMENGDTGTVSSKKQEGSFLLGREYTYEKTTDNQGRVKLKNFKLLDTAMASFQKGNGQKTIGFWDQPEVVRVTTKNISLEITNLFLSKLNHSMLTDLTPEKVLSISDHVYQWCYTGTEEKPDQPNWGRRIIERRHALQRSMEQIPLIETSLTDANDVFIRSLERAEEIVSWMNREHKMHACKSPESVS